MIQKLTAGANEMWGTPCRGHDNVVAKRTRPHVQSNPFELEAVIVGKYIWRSCRHVVALVFAFGASTVAAEIPFVTEFSVGISPGAAIRAIASGPDGNLWFTELFGNRIGRITPDGKVTEFPLITPHSYPAGITTGPNSIVAGPDGNLWFTETFGGKIGRITPAGVITEFES